MRARIFILIFSFLLLFPRTVTSQQTELGSWWMYFGYNKIHENWSVYSEAQYRSYDMGYDIEQLLLRTGLNYHITDKSSIALGYAYIGSYDIETDINSPTTEENRIWQQFMHKHKISHVGLEHRFRVEQRFIGDVYKNRLRYRLFLTIPIGKKDLEPSTFFVAVYDELFVHAEKSGFDQNRLYGALGYQFSRSTNIQMGMLNQLFKDSHNWRFQLALLWNPDLRKSD